MNNVERVGRHIVRTFYDPPPTRDDDSPIWLLGRRYDPKAANGATPNLNQASASSNNDEESTADDSWVQASVDESGKPLNTKDIPSEDPATAKVYGGWPQAFLDDFESRIWMTYRSGFEPIPKSQDPKATSAMSFRVRLQNLSQTGFASDAGFGCMIRSGQCILANALGILGLGRDWRVGESSKEVDERSILSLFADDPKAPFSIHRFVHHGASACGKYPGEWFGPSATARCIQELANDYKQAGLKVYITGDGSDVYEDSFMKIAKDANGNFQPTLVLVGTRLGIDNITSVYWEALKATLQISQAIGIAGGRPSASHYFVGVQGNSFFYLDPHETRKTFPLHADLTSYADDEISTCHTRRLRRIDIREMDPSMLIAFLIRDQADWENWKGNIASVQGKAVVHVAKSQPGMRIGREREGAIDEVESFDEHDDDGLQ